MASGPLGEDLASVREPIEWRRGGLVPLIVLALWVLAATSTITGWREALTLGAAIALFISFWSAIRKPGFPRIALLLFGGCGVTLFARSGAWVEALAWLERSALLIAFLACLYILRSLVETAPALPQVQQSFVAFRFPAKRGAIQFIAWVFGLPLAMGAISIVAPFIIRETDAARRIDLAGWALRGINLTVLFSPFTIAIGVVTSVLAEIYLPMLIGTGFLLSLCLVASAHALGQCRLPRSLPPRFWASLAAVLGPVLLIIVTNVSVIVLTDLTPAQSAVLVIPAFVVLVCAFGGTRRRAAIVGASQDSLTGYDGEITIFLSALFFAGAIQATPEVVPLIDRLADGLGPAAMIVITAIGVATLTMLGLHMVVSAIVLLTLFGPAMPDAWHLTFLALAALLGWAHGVMGSLGSVTFLASAKLMQVPARQLALGRNLWFMTSVYAILGALVLLLG